VAGLVAGESIRGSWWSHPRSHEIFGVLNNIADRPDVLLVKLLRGKVTLVHRSLWPALLGVALSREPWQLADLSAAATGLLDRLDREGQLTPTTPRDRAVTQAIALLESRLLIYTTQEHTSSGRHQRVLMSWDHWRTSTGFAEPPLQIEQGRVILESAAQNLTGGDPSQLLPWASGK
jgi:hypothetical protein